VALVLLLVAVLEGDFFEEFGDVGGIARTVVSRFGAPGAVLLLYIEESGVPLPIPGDVWVVYLGTHAAGSTGLLVAAWLAIIAAVVAGSSNLYLLSRRYGHRLIEHRLGRLLHLTPASLAAAERGMRRWGALMVIFGRHVPGFRIPITVVAGTLGLPYRTFAPSVAISSGIWAGVWLVLAVHFGAQAIHLLSGRRTVYVVGVALLVLAVAVVAARAWSRSREAGGRF